MKTHSVGFVLAALLLAAPVTTAVRADEAAAAQAQSEYVGSWKVQDGKGREFVIELGADGQAASKWAAAEEQRRNETGTWKDVDGAAQITWANGWREVISKSGEGYVKKAYAPKLTLDGAPSNESPATKIE